MVPTSGQAGAWWTAPTHPGRGHHALPREARRRGPSLRGSLGAPFLLPSSPGDVPSAQVASQSKYFQ